MNDKESQSRQEDKKTPLFMYGLIAALLVIILFFAFTDKKGINHGPSTQEVQQTPRAVPAKGKISAIKKYLAEHPGAVEWWVELAEVYAADSQFFDAIEAYEKYLSLRPEAIDTWVTVGQMYRKIKQPDKAITAFDKVIALQPNNERALFNKGAVSLYDLHDRAKTVKAWETLLSYYPDAKAPNGVPIKDMVAQVKVGMSFKSPVINSK